MHSERSTVERQAAEIIQTWLDGAPPDAAAAIAAHPDFAVEKAIVLDLAFAEFLIREHKGDRPDPEEFCARFPEHHATLGRMLAQQSLGDRPQGLDAALPDALAERTINTPVEPVRGTDDIAPQGVSTQGPGVSPKPGSTPSRRQSGVGWPQSGERVGDFDLLRQLGKGAFGRVFLAMEEPTTRHVVVKLTRQKCDEAKVLGRLGHKNVVSVLSAPHDPTSGLYMIVMPYHGSATLEDLLELAYPLRRGGKDRPKRAEVIVTAARRNLRPGDPVPPDLKPEPFLTRASFTDGVVWMGIRIADALSAVHQSGFVHHDLKPSNVLLGLDGQPRVLDFNLASDAQNAKSRLGGTLPYMPPEHLKAVRESDSKLVMDSRGDVYSLGVILYELLAGTHPFGRFPRSRSVKTVADEMLTRQRLGVRPLRERNPEVPHRLARVVERCLSFNPDDRPQTAAIVANELRGSYSAKKRTMQFFASRPGRVAVTAASIGLVSAATWFATASAREYPPMDHRAAGLASSADGRFREAIPNLTQAAIQTPRDGEVWLALGRAKLSQFEWISAKPDLEKAVELRPEHGQSHAMLGFCLVKLGHHEQAKKELDAAESLGYRPAGLYALRGYSHVSRREDELALRALNRALELDPNNRAALVNRAQLGLAIAMGSGRPTPPQAIADAEKALKAGPPDANLSIWAARFYAWIAHKPAGIKTEWHSDIEGAKARCLALLREGVELGAPESFWKGDSTYTFLFGNPAEYSAGWKRSSPEADSSGNWRTGDPIAAFPG